jgi:O-antigen ligase
MDAAHARLRLGRRARRAAALAVAVAAVAGAVAAVVSAGGPGELVGRANDAFRGPFTQTGGDLNARLLSTSGNSRADYWEIAWHTGARAPLHGTGGGTYDIAWYRNRPGHLSVRDAHSLYLETFAELGVPGVLALAVALLVPFAALRARRDWAAAAAVGAYVAYLVHAGLDWDWEVPAVTLAALACAAAAVATARRPGPACSVGRSFRIAALVAAALVATVAFVGYLGAESLFGSRTSFDAGRFAAARSHAARATALAPWSSEALLVRGQADLALGNTSAARRDFRRAVAKDPNDWQLWYRLGLASEGAERARAARQVARLNPLGIEAEMLGD